MDSSRSTSIRTIPWDDPIAALHLQVGLCSEFHTAFANSPQQSTKTNTPIVPEKNRSKNGGPAPVGLLARSEWKPFRQSYAAALRGDAYPVCATMSQQYLLALCF